MEEFRLPVSRRRINQLIIEITGRKPWRRSNDRRGALTKEEKAARAAHNRPRELLRAILDAFAKLEDLVIELNGTVSELREEARTLKDERDRAHNARSAALRELAAGAQFSQQVMDAKHDIVVAYKRMAQISDFLKTGIQNVRLCEGMANSYLMFVIGGLFFSIDLPTGKIYVLSSRGNPVQLYPQETACESGWLGNIAYWAKAATPEGYRELTDVLDPEEFRTLYDFPRMERQAGEKGERRNS